MANCNHPDSDCGYVAGHERAETRARAGQKQTICPKCNLFYWPSEWTKALQAKLIRRLEAQNAAWARRFYAEKRRKRARLRGRRGRMAKKPPCDCKKMTEQYPCEKGFSHSHCPRHCRLCFPKAVAPATKSREDGRE